MNQNQPTPARQAVDAIQELWRIGLLNNPSDEQALRAVNVLLEFFPIPSAQSRETAHDACWHCGVVLAWSHKPRCEDCPDECDEENCDEMGCAPPTPTEEIDS